jgi:beta-galactosidase
MSRNNYGQRETVDFDFDWRFLREATNNPIDASASELDDRGWRCIQTPHDFSIEQPFDRDAAVGGFGAYLAGGVGWYRKRFTLDSSFAGKRVWVEFDGVYRNSDVWWNDVHLGHRHYGFASFRYEVTEHIRLDGENVIVVRADNSDQPNCRWYSGSGIYRHVRLVATDPLCISPWGLHAWTARLVEGRAILEVRCTVENGRKMDVEPSIIAELHPRGTIDGRGKADDDSTPAALVEARIVSPLATGDTACSELTLELDRARAWSPDDPYLYHLECRIEIDGKTIDRVVVPVGIRTVEFNPEDGLLLNGVPTVLKGGNIHHDGGCVGAAVPEAVWRRRLGICKSIGANCVRFSHNPPAPELLDMCDEIGLLAIDEAFDKWAAPGAVLTWLARTHASFHEDWDIDLDAMVLRDRNHPSVILWSVGNEVVEYGDPSACLPIYRKLADRVRSSDSTRPVTMVFQYVTNRAEALHESGLAGEVDVLCLNYQETDYPIDRELRPDKLIIGTETKPYFTTVRDSKKAHYLPRNPWNDVVEHPYVVGGLLWPIIDYLGEETWPKNGWTGGIIDTCGWLKARSHYFQCVWSSEPQVRIQIRDPSLPVAPAKLSWETPKAIAHWNWPHKIGDLVHVETPTNCAQVELLLNGETCGTRSTKDSANNTIEWFVPYEPGVLEAHGLDNREIVATWTIETSGPAVRLQLETDREVLAADGHDAVHLEARIVDDSGRLVPDAETTVSFDVAGQGTLLGTDNGSHVSKVPYSSATRETFFGRALAVVRANRGGGTIRVRVTSPDYPAAEMVLGVREISPIDSSAIRTVPEDEGLLGEVLDEQ